MSLELWAGCVAGALDEQQYDSRFSAHAGFLNISIQPIRVYRAEYAREFLSGAGLDVERLASHADGKFMSAFIRADKTSLYLMKHEGVPTMEIAMTGLQAAPTVKRLNLFERYLTVWVGLCMVAGVLLGKLAPGVIQVLRDLEFGQNSHVNLPMAILIWLMITPMMMKVDFRAVAQVGQRPQGLLITLFINWVVKPFSMAFLAWVFFRFIFSAVDDPSRSGSIHRRVNHPCCCALYRHGLCVELSDGRRSGLHLGPGLGE